MHRMVRTHSGMVATNSRMIAIDSRMHYGMHYGMNTAQNAHCSLLKMHYGMNTAQIVLYPQNFTITDLAKNHRLHGLASLVNVCTTFGAIEPIYWLSETLKVTVVSEFVEKQKICTSFSKLC